MHEKPKNRDWVKNAAIIFLAVLLVLTFFSNTIMNRSLPEVATQGVTDGSIVARVRGTGTVVANSNTQVKMEKTRVIRSVLVKVGQQVQAGDVLFTLGEGSSEDIDAAEDKLRQLQTSYNRTAATMPEFYYAADQNRLEHLRGAYERAVEAEKAAMKGAEKALSNNEQAEKARAARDAAIKAREAAKIAYEAELERAATKTDTKGNLEKWQTDQSNIIEDLYINDIDRYNKRPSRYYIIGHKYGGDGTEIGKDKKNLISEDVHNDYANGLITGEEVLTRQIDIVKHRIAELGLKSPSTGEIDPITTFTIIWKDENGLEVDRTTVNQGEYPSHDDLKKSNPEQGKTYTFDGWYPTIEAATRDAEYQARFSEESVAYTITWKNDDGSVIETTTVDYDVFPDHDAPEKNNPETGKTYTFEGWQPEPVAARADAEYQARFSEETSSYTITWQNDDGSFFDTTTVNYGDCPAHDAPEKTNPEAGKTYTFEGWNPNPVVATSDAQYTASFSATEATINEANNLLMNATAEDDKKNEENPKESSEPVVEKKNESEDELNSKNAVNGVDQGVSSKTTDADELEAREHQLAILQSAQDEYRNIQSYIDLIWNDEALINAKAAYESAIADVEKWETAYWTYYGKSGTPETEAYRLARDNREYAEEQYLSAKQSLNDKVASNQNTIAGYNIDLADTWQQIEKAKQKLADLTGGEEAQILARVSGTIQTIDASPGDTKQKDDIIATIEAPDMGYSLSFSVTNDQANRLRPGDTATVSNFYWGTEIVATLNSIKIDQKNPQTNKLLTFDLSGNVTAGSELTLSVGQKSANYDIIIPSSSIRTDANGSFVLKVESKNSPLGNRYIARRVPVEVLASDDSNSAVSADLSFGDYVITTSSAPIKSGDLVRLAAS